MLAPVLELAIPAAAVLGVVLYFFPFLPRMATWGAGRWIALYVALFFAAVVEKTSPMCRAATKACYDNLFCDHQMAPFADQMACAAGVAEACLLVAAEYDHPHLLGLCPSRDARRAEAFREDARARAR
jgi:hypothetical protein